MNQVALASGFGCVRRFNASIRNVYHRTPTHIRRLVRQTEIQPDNQYLFRLHFRPPYHWQGMLDFLATRATPGVEVVDGGKYRRTFSLNSRDGYFEVALAEGRDALLLRIAFSDPQSLFFIVERVRSMFDLNADWAAIAQNLRCDPILCARVESDPGIRVPGCWNGFELGVRAILGQQITVKGATAMAGRMASRFGRPFCGPAGLTHVFPGPEVLVKAPLGDIGLTGARVKTVRHRKVDGAIRGHARARRARCLSLHRSRTLACYVFRELSRSGVARRSLEALARLRRNVSLENLQSRPDS